MQKVLFGGRVSVRGENKFAQYKKPLRV